MRHVWLLLAIGACKSPSGDDEFPVDPNGNGKNPIGMGLDASTIDTPTIGDGAIMGRVCLVRDLRGLACSDTNAGQITVTLGTQSAVTADNGTFTLTPPSGSNLVWRASGAGVISSVMPFGTTAVIPSITDIDYQDLQNANSVILSSGQGSIVARIVHGTTPIAGATASAKPDPQYATKYDGVAALAWTELATSNAGVAWIAGADVGTATVTVTPASGTGAIEAVHVEDQAITYVTIDLP